MMQFMACIKGESYFAFHRCHILLNLALQRVNYSIFTQDLSTTVIYISNLGKYILIFFLIKPVLKFTQFGCGCGRTMQKCKHLKRLDILILCKGCPSKLRIFQTIYFTVLCKTNFFLKSAISVIILLGQ